MRLPASLAILLAILLLCASVSVDAKSAKAPKPAKKAARAVLSLAHEGGDAARDAADDLLRNATQLPQRLPAAPTIQLRASLEQPGVRGSDGMIAALWVGSSGGEWNGAWWIESDAGNTTPALLTMYEEGTILQAFGGAAATGASVTMTWHFLGADGQRVSRALPPIPILDATPVTGGADAGGAVAAQGTLLVTPWNLVGESARMGFTILGPRSVHHEVAASSCASLESRDVEPGCRALYVMRMPDEATGIELWHLDAAGARVVDRALDRAQLADGYTFG